MEFPEIGACCSFRACNRLDLLPMKCWDCLELFCRDHFASASHECPTPKNRDVRVPECPLCGTPVPVQRGETPDVALGEHIDNMCQSDPAIEKREKVFTNRCSYKRCKTKEMIPVVCPECELNYCIKHRHVLDHACEDARRKAANSEGQFLTIDLGGGIVSIARSLAQRVGAAVKKACRPSSRYRNGGDSSCQMSAQSFLKIVAGLLLVFYVVCILHYMFNRKDRIYTYNHV